ncbi:MAG TPA: TonB-dependent receptor [Pyrinomonadaceae bacterium]|nr:TonB-dependent receptor [Pyrinomonadaceae bacterium]
MKRFLSTLLFVLVTSALTFGQSTSGKLIGTVSDATGAVAGATVVITDNQTGRERTVTSDSDGSFTVPLEFGTYTVKITAAGFKTFTASDVKIDTGRDYSLAALLEVGAVSEEVTVTASGGEAINSTNAELSTTISQEQIRELPLNGRNPLSLLNLQAGVNPLTSSINGQRSSSTAVTRDGLNVQDNFIRTGAFVSDQPNVDDTGEFTFTSQNAGAEQGGGSSLVQLVTPRGGKDFHGSLFAFNRNSEFTANRWENNRDGLAKPFLNRNQYGGSISGPVPFPHFGEGGPIFDRNKAFFFFNYEAFRLAQQATITGLTTLLAPARTGAFTFSNASTGTTQTINVLSGTGFTTPLTAAQGGVLTVDPVIQARLLSRLPDTGNGVLTGTNYLQGLSLLRSDPRNRRSYTSRVDYDANDRHSLNFIFRRTSDIDARTDLAAGFSSDAFVNTTAPTDFMALAYRFTIGSSFSNEIRGGFQKANVLFDEGDTIPTSFLIAGLPFTSPEGSFRTQGRKTFYRNIQDNAVYSMGNHSFRFGGQFEIQEVTQLAFNGVTPTYTISSTANPNTTGLTSTQICGTTTCINTTDLARVNALRYTLGGIIGTSARTANLTSAETGYEFGPSIFQLDYNIYSAYVSDQWRLTPNLTLNLGLRYEYYTPLHNPQSRYLEPVFPNKDDIFSVASNGGVLNFVGTNTGTPGTFFFPDKDNFGPSVSVAYSPKFGKGFFGRILPESTVIRGGFRVGYVNDEYLRAPDAFNQANSGLGSLTTTFSNLRASLTAPGPATAPFTAVPVATTPPSFTAPPRTFVTNNANQLSSVFGVDPHYQVPRIYEWNVGIQREIGFRSVLEVRYVGSMGNQMIRSIDTNQIDTINNGFLADFKRAQSNLAIYDTRFNTCVNTPGQTPTTCTTTLGPRSAGFNPAFPGSQPTPVLSAIGGPTVQGALTNATNLSFIEVGRVGSLAQNYIGLGQDTGITFQRTSDIFALEILTNGGKYRYNALQAEIRRRFSGGLAYQVNYTFQKVLADIPDDSQVRQSPYQDNNNPGLQFGRPDYDRTHTLNANVIYELPFGKGKKFLNQGGWVNAIFGGFQFSSIINLSSGAPLSITDPRSTSSITSRSTRQTARSSLTAREIKQLTGLFETPNGRYFIDPKVLYASAVIGGVRTRIDLYQPLPAGATGLQVIAANPVGQAPFPEQVFFFNNAGEVGNLPRNFINGLPYINWDAGLSKNIRFGERMRLQLRAEAFNVLNQQKPTFTADIDISSTSFGRILSTYNQPRIMQFGARFDF